MDEISDWEAQRVLFYLKSKKKLVFEQRLGSLTKASRSVEVDVPQAKRFVFGTFGNYQLLLDLTVKPVVHLRATLQYCHAMLVF